MPPSSDQETPYTATNGSSKASQKQTSSAVHIPTKKERRNGAGKNSSGVAAAMIFNAKMSDRAKPSSPATTPRDSPDSGTDNVNQVSGHTPNPVSPLLDALSSNAFNGTITGQNTHEWARSVPAFSSSPGNLISLSDSPPIQPSSYDERALPAGWRAREHMYPPGRFASASPPLPNRHPLSYHQFDGARGGFDGQLSPKSYMSNRRSSMFSQPLPRNGNPPLPHQMQPHFYNLPEPSFAGQTSGIMPGADGFHYGFDTLKATKVNTQNQFETVAVFGYEGGLEIHGVHRDELTRVLSLTNLRGGVYNAKILPWALSNNDPEYPLIALVVHGPILPDAPPMDNENIRANCQETSGLGTAAGGKPAPSVSSNDGLEVVTHYQTTVEIYSLTSKKHYATLMTFPAIPILVPINSSLFSAPLPSGSLGLIADDGTLVVSSGYTGETWVFKQVLDQEQPGHIRCMAKVWAALSPPTMRESLARGDQQDESGFEDAKPVTLSSRTAIVALRGRWLAYSASVAANQVSLRPIVHAVAGGKVPGLNSHAPPHPPPINCLVDDPNPEKLLSQIMRVGTQELVKGVSWVGDQGMQAIKSYWNKSSNGTPSHSGRGNSPRDYGGQFPPTHGESVPASLIIPEPTSISILDLERIKNSKTTSVTTPHPIATFKAALGCSFVSFAPTGLALFAASRKGDVQIVWDLMKLQHPKSSILQLPNSSNVSSIHVRQIAIFTRNTVARVVDVVWTLPQGDRIAMITERNTIHFLDLPKGSFAWPPSKRRARPVNQPAQNSDAADSALSAQAIAANAFSAAKGLGGLAGQFMSRPRGMSTSSRPKLAAAVTTTIASGVSKSFGGASSTIDYLRHARDTKLHLPQSVLLPKPGCIRWLGNQRGDTLAAIVDGAIKIYTIKQRKSKSRPDRPSTFISSRPLERKLSMLPHHTIAPMLLKALGLDEHRIPVATPEISGWSLSISPAVTAENSGTESSIPQAEIESNAPSAPFHVDPRVRLFTYSTAHVAVNATQVVEQNESTLPSASLLLETPTVSRKKSKTQARTAPVIMKPACEDGNWVFGGTIDAVQLDVGPVRGHYDDFSAMERTTMIIPGDGPDGQVFVTTTRRRQENADADAIDDDFFDDDCEIIDRLN